jgi:ribosome-associated protein
MPTRKITAGLLANELVYTTSRSGGPGGQNVNKVSSKVTLLFDVGKSDVLSEEEKNTIFDKMSSRLTREGVLILSSQESRSQIQNKETVIQKFDDLLEKAFKKKKSRKATRPSKGSVQDRIKKKKVHGEKKKWRRKPGAEG